MIFWYVVNTENSHIWEWWSVHWAGGQPPGEEWWDQIERLVSGQFISKGRMKCLHPEVCRSSKLTEEDEKPSLNAKIATTSLLAYQRTWNHHISGGHDQTLMSRRDPGPHRRWCKDHSWNSNIAFQLQTKSGNFPSIHMHFKNKTETKTNIGSSPKRQIYRID